jgi:phosphatidylglycerophosphate synthase
MPPKDGEPGWEGEAPAEPSATGETKVTASDPETDGRSAARRWRSVVPNAFSLTRLLLGVAFPWLPAEWRLSVVLIAAVTDLADGASSRLLHASTRFGRVLDPVADKVFVLAVLGVLLWESTLTLGDVVLLAMRDLTVLAGSIWIMVRGGTVGLRRLRPSLLGKAATAAQFLFVLSVLFWRQRLLIVLVPAVCLSGLAALDYLRLFLTARAGEHGGPYSETGDRVCSRTSCCRSI